MTSIKELRKICQTGHIWLAYRYVSIYITRFLIKTSITPNQITYFWIFIGIIGSILLFFGKYNYSIIGASLILLSIILDYVDGEVARYKKIFSEKGGVFLDWVGTWLIFLLAILGITIGLFLAKQDFKILILGLLTFFGYAMVEFIKMLDFYVFKKNKSKTETKTKHPRLYGIYKRLRNVFLLEYFHVVVFLMAIFNLLEIVLIYYALAFNGMWIGKVIYETFFHLK